MANPDIPHDVADMLRGISTVLSSHAKSLDRNLFLWGEGEEDTVYDDGAVYEWQVLLDHSEVEKLVHNLRDVAKFADHLAQFER